MRSPGHHAGHVGRVDGDAAERIDDGAYGNAGQHAPFDNARPATGVGECPVDEDDGWAGGLGNAHDFSFRLTAIATATGKVHNVGSALRAHSVPAATDLPKFSGVGIEVDANYIDAISTSRDRPARQR